MRDSSFMPSMNRSAPLDQADGLRRMFAAARPRFVAVASNPQVAFAGVLLERLTAAFAALGRKTLLVDASENAPAANELAVLDLGTCIEPLWPDVAYLAARGLPMRYVDPRGSCAGLLSAVADALPNADVVVMHAPANELARLFAHRAVRPVLLAADHPSSVTTAYGAMKLLALRNGLMTYDVLLAVEPGSPRRERIVGQLSSCADRFLGAVVHEAALIDPATEEHEAPGADLLRLAHDLLALDDEGGFAPAALHATPTGWPAAALSHS